MTSDNTISVIGLGYVGLPLAIALACHFRVHAFDIDNSRISELGEGLDRTGEVEPAVLKSSGLQCLHMGCRCFVRYSFG